MKIVGLLIAVAICLGCSSLSDVIAQNHSSETIQLRVRDDAGEDWRGSLRLGESAKVWQGFGGPKGLTFEVGSRRFAYDTATMPAKLARVGRGASLPAGGGMTTRRLSRAMMFPMSTALLVRFLAEVCYVSALLGLESGTSLWHGERSTLVSRDGLDRDRGRSPG